MGGVCVSYLVCSLGEQLVVYAPALESSLDGGRRGRDGADDGGDKKEAEEKGPAGAGRDAKPFKWCAALCLGSTALQVVRLGSTVMV